MTEQIRWDSERKGVFAGRVGSKIVGRVADEQDAWEWATYRDGWTHDHGKCKSFADACDAVARSHNSNQ